MVRPFPSAPAPIVRNSAEAVIHNHGSTRRWEMARIIAEQFDPRMIDGEWSSKMSKSPTVTIHDNRGWKPSVRSAGRRASAN